MRFAAVDLSGQRDLSEVTLGLQVCHMSLMVELIFHAHALPAQVLLELKLEHLSLRYSIKEMNLLPDRLREDILNARGRSLSKSSHMFGSKIDGGAAYFFYLCDNSSGHSHWRLRAIDGFNDTVNRNGEGHQDGTRVAGMKR